ncbi:hypothetical protein PWT90_01068 [Aphanocladium album]|nr:hypothetical protein PWT90_01068 [Aphanocladium album]
MTKSKEQTGLFSLPLELRRAIILDVLTCGRRKEPTLTKKLVSGRVRLRNCFDADRPETTNIYVQRHKNRFRHGNALLATCHQLRSETLTLINDTIKPGRAEVPFVLDVMLVKDVGVFPTWMSFPYKPRHIKKLTVQVRIVRPGRLVVPPDWFEAARYKKSEHDFERSSPSAWNLFVVLVVYALSGFTATPPAAAAARAELDLAPTQRSKHRDRAAAARPLVVDAHLLDAPPYMVDEMLIRWRPHEQLASGKAVRRPWVPDPRKKSDHYRSGYHQFGRDLFSELSAEEVRRNPNWPRAAMQREGTLACHDLTWAMHLRFSADFSWFARGLEMYFDLLANNIGVVRDIHADGKPCLLVDGGPNIIPEWEYIEVGDVAGALRAEEKKTHPSEYHLKILRTAKRRLDMGWRKVQRKNT